MKITIYLYVKLKIKIMKIKRNQVRELINDLRNGTIYSVVFTKKDGSERLMNSIKGTAKGIKGVGLKYDADDKGLIPVFDLQLRVKGLEESKCWRMINVNTVKELCINKEKLIVDENI